MSSSNESAELRLVSSIRYKFANVSGDERKLSDALQAQLTPLLEKAGSPHKAVRDATFQAFISVNNFVKPTGVILPVAALLEQYKSTGSPMVKQLDLGLIKQGILRLDQQKRRGLLPVALRGISKETSHASSAGYFNIFLRLLLEIQVPGRGSAEDTALREAIGLSDPADAKYVADWLGRLFLLRQDLAVATEQDIDGKLSSPTGLDKGDISFLRNNNPQTWEYRGLNTPNSLSLPECKVKAINFLASGAFTDEERYLPTICAAGSTDSRITAIAEDVLKRSSINLEDVDTIQSLYQAHDRFPVPHRIQILRLLSKSMVACTLQQQVIDAVKQDFDLSMGEKSPVVGLEALRLHKALLAFLAWISRNNADTGAVDRHMAPSLVLILKDFILKQGWPTPTLKRTQSQLQDEERLRANAYETIGTLARGGGFEHRAKDALLKWLFDSLVSDSSSDIVVYIESALSSMMGLFKSTDQRQNNDLEILLLEYMTLPERQGIRTARHVAARFANNCLPYSNIKARWIDILALAGGPSERRDVVEEGSRGLDPWWSTKLHPDGPFALPDWVEMTSFLFDTTPRELGQDDMAIDRVSTYALFPDHRLQAFPLAIRYAKQMLFLSALGEKSVEIDWEAQIERRMQNDLESHKQLREYIRSMDGESLLRLLNAAFDGLRDHPGVGEEDYVSCLADVLSFAPSESISAPLSERTHQLLPAMKSNNYKARQLAAKAFGILAPWSNHAPTYATQLRGFIESCGRPSAAQSAQYQGSLISLAAYLSRAAYYGKMDPAVAPEHVEFLYKTFQSILDVGDSGIQNAALDSMAELWTANIGFPKQNEEVTKTIESLTKLAATGNEKAILSLGRLAIPTGADKTHNDTEPLTQILDKSFSLSELKRTEVHFATGEAIAAAIARWDSESVRLGLDVEPAEQGRTSIIDALGKRSTRVTACLDRLIRDSKTTKPSLLKASGIWLFCVIQFCSNLSEVQSRLRECQVAFMRLLTARDELVQETASRGLALVYEKGDQSLKGDLVRDLVASFTGTKTQLKVDEDTELFDAGALPTGEGKSITSYKDIINLANEVGDQSLIYKFMSLATNAATWTTRSAFGRFGLSSILSEAELDPKIYPKLYRYRFDPNSNVRRSMDDIWKSVVKDQNAVLDTHFDAIMVDLLKSILDGREWRVREASCAAVADLVHGQPFPKYEKYYIDIWQKTLRVLDDQKGSVRAAAFKLCIGLSKTLVTQLQENNSSAAARGMMAQALPFLLSDKGSENSVQEVKFMAISTVLDIVKHGGDALRPFITSIITHFLGLLSTVEPEQINYAYQRVSEEDRENLDKLRSTAATRSPLFECIVNCLRFIDDAVMKELVPQLVTTIKSALGMQTKVGCSEVLSTLALRHSILLPPHNPMLMKSMETQILDRNHEVSKAYARSTAYILRSASPETRERFNAKLCDLYFAAEDESRRQKVADTVLAIAKISPDVFTDLESRLLPFSYLAQHDTDDYVSEVSKAVWEQHAGGSHTVRRFTDEITEFVSRGLGTSKWGLQHGAALTIASMVTALSSAAGKGGQFSDANIQKIWPVLDKALALKTFKGKEKLVTAYPLFIRHGKQLWSSEAAMAAHSKKIALREAKRNNEEYRPYAFEALAEYAAAREDIDMYAEVVSLVSEYLTPDTEAHKVTELEKKTAEAALVAIMSAHNRQKMRNSPAAVLGDVAATVEGAKQAIALAGDIFFIRATDLMKQATAAGRPSDADSSALSARWFRLLADDDGPSMLESQRTHRAKALDAFVSASKHGVFGPAAAQGGQRTEMEAKLKSMIETERSIDVQKLLGHVVKQLTG